MYLDDRVYKSMYEQTNSYYSKLISTIDLSSIKAKEIKQLLARYVKSQLLLEAHVRELSKQNGDK